jgi:hypothetical protein
MTCKPQVAIILALSDKILHFSVKKTPEGAMKPTNSWNWQPKLDAQRQVKLIFDPNRSSTFATLCNHDLILWDTKDVRSTNLG